MTTTENRVTGAAPSSGEDWIERARAVARQLAEGGPERDRAARPRDEDIALLKESGLVTLQAPAEYGGGGHTWGIGTRVVREIAAVDGGLGQVLGWNFLYYDVLGGWSTPEQHERLLGGLTRQQALLAGSVNLTDAPYSGVDEGEAIVLSGRKEFNTGVPVADRVLANVALPGSDAWFVVVLPGEQTGIRADGAWDTLGARSTASGPLVAEDVRVPWSDALGYENKEFRPRPANATPGLPTQALLANFFLGTAQGAYDRAVTYVQEHGRSWLHSPYESAVDEPHVLDGFGELRARLWAARSFVDEVNDELDAALRSPEQLDEQRRGALSVRIGAAKTVATEVGLTVTSRVLELSGARSTAVRYGIERAFRDLRTQTLHDPVAYKQRQIGAWVLRGDLPGPLDFYS